MKISVHMHVYANIQIQKKYNIGNTVASDHFTGSLSKSTYEYLGEVPIKISCLLPRTLGKSIVPLEFQNQCARR